MDFFRSGIKSVLGSTNADTQFSSHEAVERLIERINSSVLLEDRRDACRTLKAMSTTYRLEVAKAMDTLINVLKTDSSDPEIIVYACDTLYNITSKEIFEEEAKQLNGCQLSKNAASLGEQFTEIFTKDNSNVCLLLNLLDDYDFNVRWPVTKLLMNLLNNQGKSIQEIVLESPMGISKIMDLLSDDREVIRNEALLILFELTKGNPNIQKIVAFENAFEHLLGIIRDEGYSEGNVVVEDCLHILLNLLKNNVSNQTYFREGGYIQKLTPFFNFSQHIVDEGLSAQTVKNVDCMLQVVRTLVSPTNPSATIHVCQNLMKSHGLLQALCNVLIANELPISLVQGAINTVAEIIRKNINNQEFFLSLSSSSSPPRPAVVLLLYSMINEKTPLGLRCAILYCFQCFLYKNESGQAWIAKSLIPMPNEAATAGRLLCRGLFSENELSNWFAAVALSYSTSENLNLKEFLLSVQLSTARNQHSLLMQECTLLCLKTTKIQTRIGTIILLCNWLVKCPKAVNEFLGTTNIPSELISKIVPHASDSMEELCQGLFAFLLGLCVHFNDNSLATSSKEHIIHMIEKTVGFETFTDKISHVSKHEMYTRSHKHPQLDYESPNDVVLDFEFCRLFKSLESSVIKTIIPEVVGVSDGLNKSSLSAEEEKILNHYKDIIRQQDEKLKIIANENNDLLRTEKQMKDTIESLESTIQQYRDENLLLQSQVQSFMNKVKNAHETPKIDPALQNSVSSDLNMNSKNSSEERINAINDYENEKVRQLETLIANLRKEKEQAELVAENIRREEEDLLVLLSDTEEKLNSVKAKLRELGGQVSDEDDYAGDFNDIISDDEDKNLHS